MGRRNRKEAGASPGADYATWIATIPQEDRLRIAEIVRDHEVGDYRSFSALCQKILAELLAGNITPEVANQARLWAELMFTTLATENSAAGTPENAQNDVMVALAQAALAARQLQGSYTQDRERVILEVQNE